MIRTLALLSTIIALGLLSWVTTQSFSPTLCRFSKGVEEFDIEHIGLIQVSTPISDLPPELRPFISGFTTLDELIGQWESFSRFLKLPKAPARLKIPNLAILTDSDQLRELVFNQVVLGSRSRCKMGSLQCAYEVALMELIWPTSQATQILENWQPYETHEVYSRARQLKAAIEKHTLHEQLRSVQTLVWSLREGAHTLAHVSISTATPELIGESFQLMTGLSSTGMSDVEPVDFVEFREDPKKWSHERIQMGSGKILDRITGDQKLFAFWMRGLSMPKDLVKNAVLCLNHAPAVDELTHLFVHNKVLVVINCPGADTDFAQSYFAAGPLAVASLFPNLNFFEIHPRSFKLAQRRGLPAHIPLGPEAFQNPLQYFKEMGIRRVEPADPYGTQMVTAEINGISYFRM